MSYSVSDALDAARDAVASRCDVELQVRSTAGHIQSFRLQLARDGVTAFADVDCHSVLLKVVDHDRPTGDRYGFSSAEQAAALALEFIALDVTMPLRKLFARYGRRPAVHELKSWPQFFRPLYRGEKQFEFRRDDRGFKVGDALDLREWDPRPIALTGDPDTQGEYTGAREMRAVTYILRDAVGVPPQHVVMSLGPMP